MYIKEECTGVTVKLYVCEWRMCLWVRERKSKIYACERRMYVCERARMNSGLSGPSSVCLSSLTEGRCAEAVRAALQGSEYIYSLSLCLSFTFCLCTTSKARQRNGKNVRKTLMKKSRPCNRKREERDRTEVAEQQKMRLRNQTHRGRDTEKLSNAERAIFRVDLCGNNEELILQLNTSVFRPQCYLQT